MTNNEKYIVDMYVRYFGRAADAATIADYALDKKTSVILKNIIADADAEKAELSKTEFVNNAFQNLFGRNATTKEMSKYYKVVDAGKDLPINSIVKSAAKNDKKVYDNKKAVALKYAELGGKGDLDLSKISKDNLVDLNFLNTVTKAADLEAKIDTLAENSGIPSSFDGKTFVLTEGVDAGKDFIGTSKDDQFIADNSVKVNASAADTLDGGKGTDTFKLYDDATGTTTGLLPTLKNIENVVIYDNKITIAAVDLRQWDTVETLFLVRDANAFAYTLGGKVTTVNLEDTEVAAAGKVLTFDKALTDATLGVNNVTGAGITTVNGTALKTLTVNAYGKESTISNISNAAIETLNINGKANLTLGTTGLTTVKTVDGSKAEGNLTFSNTASMTSIKTGSGNDTLNVAVAVESGETINLGAGNDKLLFATGGSVATSTTTVIDGGAGIDSLDAALVTAGNAGVFANFETLSLTATAADLDLNLVNKSTFTTIAIDGNNAGSTVRNVSTSQSLTVNAAANTTTLLFKNVAGTADAYKINFAKDAAPTAPATTVDAGTVIIDKIETVTVNSTGKTATTGNIIKLDGDAAKSLVITGDKAIDVTFTGTFGDTTASAANGLGVSTIDASAATGAVTINTGNVNVAFNGLTIKGGTANDSITLVGHKATVNAGAGDDTIITSVDAGALIGGGTLTGGAGKDTFDISASVLAAGQTTEAGGVVKVTITDLTAGDKIEFANKGTEVFNKIKLDVSTASNLDAALTTAFAGNGGTDGIINWFQFAGNTYIVEDVLVATSAGAGDIVVKINGLVDLSNSTYVAGTDTLTIA